MINLQVEEELAPFLFACRHVWIGYSGGLDSTVLLHLLANDRRVHSKLKVIHVNHGLSPHAFEWENHCQKVCQAFNLPLFVERVTLDKTGNLEEKAREARYALFKQHLEVNDILVLAHHKNDQAETFLLNVCRGAGIDGLAAMKLFKPFHDGFLWRPLLDCAQKHLQSYAKCHALDWVEDESNQTTYFARNYVRHKVLPLLEARWPATVNHLAKASLHCQQSQTHLDELATLDCPELVFKRTTLLITPLLALPQSRLFNVLRYWLRVNGLKLPRAGFLQQLLTEIIQAKASANPQLSCGSVMINRYQNTLYLLKTPLKAKTLENVSPKIMDVAWLSFPEPLSVGSEMIIEARSSAEGVKILPGSKLSVRFRQGGEEFYWRRQTKSLKKLFQEWQIPVWRRQRTPLVYINDVLAMVVGYAISDLFYHRNQEHLYLLGLARQESHE